MPARILVIDDEEVVIRSARKILGFSGHLCDGTDSVREALLLLKARAYDVVLTDLMLPVQSGFDILESMERDYPSIPCIMITGFATRQGAIDAINRHAFDFLPKPFEVDELLSVVSRALAFSTLGTPEDILIKWKRERLKRAPGAQFHFLGMHTWARQEQQDETVLTGVAESFPQAIQPITDISFPEIGDHIQQGDPLLTLKSETGAYTVWSPIAGRVTQINEALRTNPEPLQADPFFDGWLVRMRPSDTENDFSRLITR